MGTQLAPMAEINWSDVPIQAGDWVQAERVYDVEDKKTRKMRRVQEVIFGNVARTPNAPSQQTQLRVGQSTLRGGVPNYVLRDAVVHERDGAIVSEKISAHAIVPEARPLTDGSPLRGAQTLTIERIAGPEVFDAPSQSERLPLQ